MVSANNNKGKEPLEDDPQDPKLEEEVESEAEGEVEEEPRARPRATIPSIGVVTNPFKLKRGARMSTRGKVDRKSTRLNSSHSGESRMPSSA